MTGEVPAQTHPVQIIVAARDRPIYLWACLDSLYRLTRTPHAVTLIDMASDNPMVAGIITAFQRRGLIERVLRMPANDPALLAAQVMSRLDELAPYFVYMEADAVVCDRDDCWLAHMVAAMTDDPDLALLGTAIDKRDFVDIETARGLEPELDEAALAALIKAHSPERTQRLEDAQGQPVFHPHGPPGRLMLVRTEALRRVGPGTDAQLDVRLRAIGYRTGILTAVQHRHLSLLHIFDQPAYDYLVRDEFMRKLDGSPVRAD